MLVGDVSMYGIPYYEPHYGWGFSDSKKKSDIALRFDIDSDKKLYKTCSPYTVTGNFWIKSGATLTVDNGVTVNINDSKYIKVDGDLAYVGITNFAQGELGDIVFVELPNSKDDFKQNDIFGTIEAVKTLADLYIPVSGSIIAINNNLESEPELINSDPYGKGWIVKIEISNIPEIDALLSDVDYNNLIG